MVRDTLWAIIVPQARRDHHQLTKSYWAGFPISLPATALAFWNTYVSIALCLSLWVVWAITGCERQSEDSENGASPLLEAGADGGECW